MTPAPVPTERDWSILSMHGIKPDKLLVLGSLYLTRYCEALTALPEGLHVEGKLHLLGCYALTAFPQMYVDEELVVIDCPGVFPLYTDLRPSGISYRLDRIGPHYFAGCRRFIAADAIAHWNSPDYPVPSRGARFVKAIRDEETRRRRPSGLPPSVSH